MKKIGFATLLAAAGLLTACNPSQNQQDLSKEITVMRSAQTENLLRNLHQMPQKGIMFGHQDDTAYGIGWDAVEDSSDVKAVCGAYPAVMGFDLGELELGGEKNLDGVPFETIKREAVKQYKRGGMVTMGWHVRNPKTEGDAWDVSDTTVVKSVLPGGECHKMFIGWVDKVAEFMNSLQTEEGVKVPVLFRPWHEHTGSWFWWGQKLCSTEDYVKLWRMTVSRLTEQGVDNLLYAYSSGTEPQNTEQYVERFPGDDIIDVIGFDTYQFDRDSFLEGMERMLTILDDVAKTHNKVAALTEVGNEGIPDPTWWTGTLLPAMENHSAAYVLAWRNARERVTHYYAPYPGQASAADFVEFYNSPKTLFEGQVNVYE